MMLKMASPFMSQFRHKFPLITYHLSFAFKLMEGKWLKGLNFARDRVVMQTLFHLITYLLFQILLGYSVLIVYLGWCLCLTSTSLLKGQKIMVGDCLSHLLKRAKEEIAIVDKMMRYGSL